MKQSKEETKFKKAFVGKTIYTLELDGEEKQMVELPDALLEIDAAIKDSYKKGFEDGLGSMPLRIEEEEQKGWIRGYDEGLKQGTYNERNFIK